MMITGRDIGIAASTALFTAVLWLLCACVASLAESADRRVKMSETLGVVVVAQLLIALALAMLSTAPGLTR